MSLTDILSGNAITLDASSPTGPIPLPVTGMLLDPLAPPEPEPVPTVEPPTGDQLPLFPPTGGLFGSGFARAALGSPISRVAVAVGEGKVFVLAGYARRVYVYDSVSDALVTSFPAPAGTLRDIDYYDPSWGDPKLYVLAENAGSKVSIYDTAGQLEKTLTLKGADNAGGFSGLDAGFGELWAARPPNTTGGNPDLLGQEVAVFDAQSGALKGQGRQPAGDTRAQTTGPRNWWDVSLVPELSGAVSDRRLFSRAPLAGGLPLPDSPTCAEKVLYACVSADQKGTDAVWGMKWFLEIAEYASGSGYRPVEEYAITDRPPIALPLIGTTVLPHPGHYLVHKRTWTTRQPGTDTVSDIAYQNRELRVDAWGFLAQKDWLRGQKCLSYIVSDADIFPVGDQAEHWYEPARNFNRIEFYFNGQLKGTQTSQSGQFCVPTTDYANRPGLGEDPYPLQLKAVLNDGKTATFDNGVKIDNAPPTGTLDSFGPYVRRTVTASGSVTDAPSGARDWQLQLQRPGSSTWEPVCTDSAPKPEVGLASCAWDTTQYPDGTYQLRARLRDLSSDDQTLFATETTDDDGNVAYSPVVTTMVDNTPPELAQIAPAVGSPYASTIDEDLANEWLIHTDGTSGVAKTEFEYNTAPDGTDSGSWQPARADSPTEPGETFTEWDTSDVEDGEHQVRATTSDRAGNQSTKRFHIIFSARRKPCPDGPAGHNRCYAGINAGDIKINLFNKKQLMAEGIRADISKAETIPSGSGFSGAAVGLRGPFNNTVEVGIANNNCRGNGAADDYGKHDWWAYGYHKFAETPQSSSNPCLYRAQAGQRRYKVRLNGDYALALSQKTENGPLSLRTVVSAGDLVCQRNCFVQTPTTAVAFGETNRLGRELAGDFSDVQYDSPGSGGYKRPPDSDHWKRVDQGPGYRTIFRNAPSFFCVDGPDNGGCEPLAR